MKEMAHFRPQNLPQVPLHLITKPPPENERKKKDNRVSKTCCTLPAMYAETAAWNFTYSV